MRRPPARAIVLLALVAGAACRTRPWQIPTVVVPFVQATCKQAEGTPKIDFLVMVDNSTSMDPMQAALRARFADFLDVFHTLEQQGRSFDLHIGVVTSDYGAGKSGSGNCEPSPGGQRGRLQAVGQFAAATCKPPVGANYVAYQFGPGTGNANNLPPGQSLDATFTCMATVGARGCGAEHQLESVRAALEDDIPENAGFLRDDALLVVLFFTNEDDCSAPPDTDLFDPYLDAKYGSNLSYRCTRYGILCGQPPAMPPYGSSDGPLAMCVSAPNPDDMGPGRLFDIGRYLTPFTQPKARGGLKVDPSDVMLAAIDAPAAPFESVLVDPSTGEDGKPYTLCSTLSETGNPPCTPALQHSCQNATNGGFFGDPSVRLNAVVAAAANHALTSICDYDEFSSSLANLGALIVSQVGDCCVPGALPPDPRTPTDPGTFIADCRVSALTHNADGTTTSLDVPACSQASGFPCFQVVRKPGCTTLSPQGLGVTVQWNGVAPPPHTTLSAACAGVPQNGDGGTPTDAAAPPNDAATVDAGP